MVVRIAVNGAAGRMGRRILSIAMAQPQEYKVVGAFESKGSKWCGNKITIDEEPVQVKELTTHLLKNHGKGILIDFSSPAGTHAALIAAREAGWGLVIGTTGLDEGTIRLIRDYAKKIPVVHSSNMSVGANLLLELVALAAGKLPYNFDIEITEAHHRHKKDRPSGTALSIAEVIAKAKGWDTKKGWDIKKILRYRAEGKSDKDRGREEIGMQVVRAGEIVGDHTVLFAGLSETIEVKHHAQTRTTFARGALQAAAFIEKKKKGLFTMRDVLGL